MFIGFAWVAGGARNDGDWAWLTGRVVQDGFRPLHQAAFSGHDAAIKALVAARADVDAETKVRGVGEGGGVSWEGQGAAWSLKQHLVWNVEYEVFGQIQSVKHEFNGKLVVGKVEGSSGAFGSQLSEHRGTKSDREP